MGSVFGHTLLCPTYNFHLLLFIICFPPLDLFLLCSTLTSQPETRWDRFAKEKGITGSKRAKMIWDDEMKEWRPRHGYKRANDGVLNHPIVEVKAVSDHSSAHVIESALVGSLSFRVFSP